MQFIISRLTPVRTGVGDILMIFLPLDRVALLPHQPAEMLFAFGFLHCVVYCTYQIDFPTLAFHSGVVLTRRDTFAFLLQMRLVQSYNTVPLTDFIGQLTHSFQRELI